MNPDGSKPPVAPKPMLLGPVGFRLASPLLPRACSSKGPKPAVAPKPRVLQDRQAGSGACSPGPPTRSDRGPLTGRAVLGRGSEAGQSAALDPRVRGSDSGDPGVRSASREVGAVAGTPSGTQGGDATHPSHQEVWAWQFITGSGGQGGAGAGGDGLASESMEMTEEMTEEVTEDVTEDMTEDVTSDGCDAGEALADMDDSFSVGECSFSVGECSFSVGECSLASVEEEEVSCSSLRGPRLGDVQDRKETLEDFPEDQEVPCTTDPFTGSWTKHPAVGTEEPLKVRDHGAQGPAGGYEVTADVLDLGSSPGTIRAAQNQGNQVLSEVQAKPEPDYVCSEDVIEGRRILLDHHMALKARSPLIQHKHLLADSTGALPRKYRCITEEDPAVRKGLNNEPVESQSPEDEDKERISTRENRLNVQTQDHQTWLFNASLDCRPRFKLVSFCQPPDLDVSVTSSLSEGQLSALGEGHLTELLDVTTDTEQDLSEEHVYEETGQDPDQDVLVPFEKRSVMRCSLPLSGKPPYFSRLEQAVPALTSSPVLSAVRTQNFSKPAGPPRYPRSVSVEGQDLTLRLCEGGDGADRLSRSYAFGSSGSFSRRPPRPCSGVATPTSMLDIPPPFELACITKRPITKSSPSLLMTGDAADKNKKKKSSIKRFLMLKFKKKSSDRKPAVELPSPSSRSSSESIHLVPGRPLEVDRDHVSLLSPRSAGPSPHSSPSLHLATACGAGAQRNQRNQRNQRSLAFLTRSVIRVESFEDRSGGGLVALPLTKPRSISFPNTDSSSDYENVPPLSAHYENVQVRVLDTFSQFFDRPYRARSTAHDTDGYVDMSSFPGFERRTRAPADETESAYTEAYKVCSLATGPGAGPRLDQGQTSEDEGRGTDGTYDHPPDGRSRAFYIAKELLDTERQHVEALKRLQEDFREAVSVAVGEEGGGVLADDRLREILNELPDVYALHLLILTELQHRIQHWDDSQRIADVILSRKADFFVFTSFIGHYDRNISLLEDSCRSSPAFAAVVTQFEQRPECEGVSLKHQLLQIIVRIAQYRMLLTDYLNNLRPDSQEYEDTQAAVVVVSDIADQANDSLQHGENLLRLVNIEYSVRGQRNLLQPGRVFIKEGTLMKVSRKSTQPRHLFLMNDVLLYTYPQQDGKYRLKNTLSLSGMKVSKPGSEDAQSALQIEAKDISVTLSASSSSEREDWFMTLSRTVLEHARTTAPSGGHREEGGGPGRSLGEEPPAAVCASQVQMCMNCTCDFSLRLRRHHCHACGRIVCRSCSRNRYPLKYMKDRLGKVCDHCYTELHSRGTLLSASAEQTSPPLHRPSRPLSAVFQNIHAPNLWRHRKGMASFTPSALWEEGAISGSLQRSKRKHHWKRLWFLLKDKVLYTYRAQEEKVASESLPLLGFTVKLADGEQQDEANLFQLYHKKTLYYTFRAENNCTAQRWVNAMEEATVL